MLSLRRFRERRRGGGALEPGRDVALYSVLGGSPLREVTQSLAEVSVLRPRAALAAARRLRGGEVLALRSALPRPLGWYLRRHGFETAAGRASPSADSPNVVRLGERLLRGASRRDAGEPLVVVARERQPGAALARLTGLPETGALRISVSLSWRGRSAGATATVEAGDDARFAKIGFDRERAARLGTELHALRTIAWAGPGVGFPARAELAHADEGAILSEDVLTGIVAARLPTAAVEAVFDRLLEWLRIGHTRTLRAVPGAPTAGAFARRLGLDGSYPAWLDAEAVATSNGGDLRAAVHGDLTLWNVLQDATRGTLTIVDWEAAEQAGAPVSDLFYAAVDAELARGTHSTRLEAFDALFPAGAGPIAAATRAGVDGLRLDPRSVRLWFHETWLGHALNEAGRDEDSGRLVRQRLAVDPSIYPWSDVL